MAECRTIDLSEHRRVFWVTQPGGCGEAYDRCGNAFCGRPGLKTERSRFSAGARLSTENYVCGLALNILLTKGAAENPGCGLMPGGRGGHWSDSFTGARSGSALFAIAANLPVRETTGLIRAAALFDMQKLTEYGVCDSVEAEAAYEGGNRWSVRVRFFAGGARIGALSAQAGRADNMWVWKA